MSEDWKIYRTRFLTRARQLTEPLTFNDSFGREHRGRPGDYLVHSADGARIVRREIFEDVYIMMESQSYESPRQGSGLNGPTQEIRELLPPVHPM
jgi:hypothetical protein